MAIGYLFAASHCQDRVDEKLHDHDSSGMPESGLELPKPLFLVRIPQLFGSVSFHV